MKKANIHQVGAKLVEQCLRNKQSVELTSRGSFHLFMLDKVNNPLNKRLTHPSLAVLYMPDYISIVTTVINRLPKYYCIVAATNPETGLWINGKPDIKAMYGVLKRDTNRQGSILVNLWHFALAIYDLLFIQGEYRYRDWK